MAIIKGKLQNTLEVRKKLLEIAHNKDFCYGINQYGYLTFVDFVMNEFEIESQWWVVSDSTTYKIRNCGKNETINEYRYWKPDNGICKIKEDYFDKENFLIFSIYQTFNAMRIYMNEYFLLTQDRDIGLLLTDLMLSYDPDELDWVKKIKTWDPPAWEDWMAGVQKTLKDMNLQDQDPMKIKYDENMAFLCMKNYLNIFYEEIKFEGVKNILTIINAIDIGNLQDKEWRYWLNCVQAAIDQEPNIIG